MNVNSRLASGRTKHHGKSWEAYLEENAHQSFRWLHDSLGTDWRTGKMTEQNIGRIQLTRMDDWSYKRLANANAIWRCSKKIKWFACT